MYSKSSPLIVIRSSDICFTGILRGCHSAGVKTVAVTFDWDGAPDWLSEHSHCLNERFEIANPFTDSEKAVVQFKGILKDLFDKYGHKLMVLPSSDTNLMFLMDHFEEFQPYMLTLGACDFEAPRLDLIHKGQCAELLARRVPELVPITYLVRNHSDIEAAAKAMQYPCIYKPAVKDYGQSFYASHQGLKAIECDDQKALIDALVREIEAGFELVVQQKISFDSPYDEIPFYLYADRFGRITMAANCIKTVIEPFPFGTAIVLEFAWFPELLEMSRRIVDATGYRGLLMIEYVKDKSDGQWKVIEINTRHWLFNGGFHRFGLNFTQALVDDLREIPLVDDLPKTFDNKAGALGAFHADLTAVAKYLSKSDEKLSLEKYIDYLESLNGRVSSCFYDLSDPDPGVEELTRLAKKYNWDKKTLIHGISRVAASF